MAKTKTIVGAMGGTFDHFHDGHAHFLEFAISNADHVIIGITAQDLTRSKECSDLIQPFPVRKQAVQAFLEDHAGNKTWELLELTDQFGPTLGQKEIDVLIVTKLTKAGGRILNAKRQSLGLSKLPLRVSDMFKDERKQILNSSRIRAGLVNRQGRVYAKNFSRDYRFTEAQKSQLRELLGEIVQTPSVSEGITAVVGDRSLKTFLENDWKIDIGVYDRQEQRQQVQYDAILAIQPDERLKNPAGVLKKNVVQFLYKTIHKQDSFPSFLRIDGEEDLVVVGLVQLLPLRSRVYYGQPNQGMVEINVTEGMKEKLRKLLSF